MTLEFDQVAFEAAALPALRAAVRETLGRAALDSLGGVRDAVEHAIRSSPEYASLLGGDLRALFGVEEPAPVLAAVVNGVRNSVAVTALDGLGDVLGVLRVEALREDMGDVLGVEGASYVSVSRRYGTSTLVDWLNWLLLAGTTVVVAEWEAKTDRPSFTGTRTGKGVMVLPRRRAGRGFRVPPEYSGVVDDNWLTRCMAEAQPGVIDALAAAVERA